MSDCDQGGIRAIREFAAQSTHHARENQRENKSGGAVGGVCVGGGDHQRRLQAPVAPIEGSRMDGEATNRFGHGLVVFPAYNVVGSSG
jgi:hypothetical protein